MFGLSDIISSVFKIVDKFIPDKTKEQDQSHELKMAQKNIILENEKNRNYFTPTAILLYSVVFMVIYTIVIVPLLAAYGVNIPVVWNSEDVFNILKIVFALGG